MRGDASRVEYTRRFHRVIDHIDAHLDEALELATLADVAHFSPFHFHRLFAAWMGETLGEYVRRRRLEVAATRLAAQPRVSVIDIALSVGFGSAEAFARAFKARFGISASAWRKEQKSKRDQVRRKRDQEGVRGSGDHRASLHHEDTIMEVRLVERSPVRIVALRYVGPFGKPLAMFWQSRVMPWIQSRGLSGRAMIAIALDNPTVTAPARCRCDVGVEIDEDFVAIGDEQVVAVPGGRYASGHFFDTPARIEDAWTSLMRDWLPASGLQLDGRPTFEYYPKDARFDHATGAFECQLMVPVTPL